MVGLLLIYLGFFNSLYFSSPLDNDVFDGLSDIEKSVRQAQLEQCENNMGYLQSYELGQMIEERCVNGILSSIEERKFPTTP